MEWCFGCSRVVISCPDGAACRYCHLPHHRNGAKPDRRQRELLENMSDQERLLTFLPHIRRRAAKMGNRWADYVAQLLEDEVIEPHLRLERSFELKQAQTLKPEDTAGEAGEISSADDATMLRAGRTFGSRSCYYWDRFDHTCKREAAKMSCATHCPAEREHVEGYPFKELDLNPAAVYTRKFRMSGEASLRNHLGKSTRVPSGFGGQMR
eukprot:s1116_g8.t1